MKLSKYFFLIITVILLVGLSACSSKAEASTKISAETLDDMPYEMNPQEVYDAIQTGEVMVIDVREQWEYEDGHLPSAVLIPMMEVQNRLFEIPTDQHVIVTCRSGNRSAQIAEFLTNKGYTKIHDMDGGFLAWKEAGLPVED